MIKGDYVVTGGAGAIGSALVRRLLSFDASSVTVIDNFSSGYEWLLPHDPRLRVIREDITESGFEYPLGAAVFHLAAHFANQNSVDHPGRDLAVNGGGTLRALEWAVARRASKFVFASAGCAVGHCDTPYQIHKRLGEQYCRLFYPEIPTVVLRFHNSYGPGELPGRYRNVIPNWIWAALHHHPLKMFGDGTDGRDFIFVEDLVDGILSSEPSLDPHELGTGAFTLVSDLAALIIDLTGSRGGIQRLPPRRWDHPGRTAILAEDREYTGIVAGLEHTIEWFRRHRHLIEESAR